MKRTLRRTTRKTPYPPLADLVARCERKIAESGAIEQAACLPLYRERWDAAGIRPENVRSYADLRRIPFTAGEDLKKMQASVPPAEWLGGSRARLWVSTGGFTGTSKWIPLGDGDLETMQNSFFRFIPLITDSPDAFSFLFFSAPPPYISPAMAYIVLGAQTLGPTDIEFAVTSLPETPDALRFAQAAKMESLFSFPSMALLIADGVAGQAAQGALDLFRKKKTPKNMLGVLVTKIFRVKAKHIFSFKWGLFAGEPVDPYRTALKKGFGLRPFACYGSTEFAISPAIECRAGGGLHLFIDACCPEIISERELTGENQDPAYTPQAVPLWEAEPGTKGELVMTVFSDALPLVRYRISDIVEVVSTEPCACGCTHPRIRVHHRSDEIVNLGLIRFRLDRLGEKMAEVGRNGKVASWQLRLSREKSKAKARMIVVPAGETDRAAFIREVREKFDELEDVKQAWENGLIAEPEVIVKSDLTEARTETGKARRVVYEPGFNERT